MDASALEKYRVVQDIARDTLNRLKSFIQEGVSEADIADAAGEFMKSRGVSSFWYHGVIATVLVGGRTTLSVSGRDYKPSNTKVKKVDLVTVDVTPEVDSCWGDLARSFVVEDGKVVENSSPAFPPPVNEFFAGVGVEDELHMKLLEVVTPEMSFEEMYHKLNRAIDDLGYVNLDFRGNLGHTIERSLDDRIYIEEGVKTKLSETQLFTFEPHIKKKNGLFGFKREDIYYFSRGKLKIL